MLEMVLAFIGSPLCDRHAARLAFRLLLRALLVPGLGLALARHQGLIAWVIERLQGGHRQSISVRVGSYAE